MDEFNLPSSINWVNKINADKAKKETAKLVASKLWVKPKDITIDMLSAYPNATDIMKWVCMWILEFYGLSLWELGKTTAEKIINKYKISEKELNTLLDYWDVWLAYSEYVKNMLWDKPSEREQSTLQSIKENVIVDETATNAVIQKMRADEKARLQSLIDNETDSEKKEMYEAQMKVLTLKEKNWWTN